MSYTVIPILVVSRFEIDGLPTHSSDSWPSTFSREVLLMLKCLATMLEKYVYRRVGKCSIKTTQFPAGKIKFGTWTDNDKRLGFVGIYWSLALDDATSESLLRNPKSTASEFSATIILALSLLEECAKQEDFPGQRSFFLDKYDLGLAEKLAFALRKLSLRNESFIEAIQPDDSICKIYISKTRREPFKRSENLKGALKNIRAEGPEKIKGTITVLDKKKSILVEYPESIKTEILDILKSGQNWNFEFEVYHEFINGVANITKLNIVDILDPCEKDDGFIF